MIAKTEPIIRITLFTISSWFLVHLLAIFGVFVAAAYPLWWFIAPNLTTCFMCRSKKEGDWCPFCKKYVEKTIVTPPKTVTSALLNGLLVLLFSLFSTALLFGESKILFKMGFPPTPKTVSFVIPAKGQFRIGEIFPMKIDVAGIKVPVNTVQADIGFDPSKIEVVDISTEESFANVFIQKEINDEAGYARLTGGLPNPGYLSDHGVFGTVYFRGKAAGVVKIEFLPTSRVLANDGRGTDVLKEFSSVSYLILPEKITPEEEELQKKLISLNPSVLGEETTNTQIKFFNEQGSVLGEMTNKEISKANNIDILAVPMKILERFDSFVVERWARLFSFLNKKVF